MNASAPLAKRRRLANRRAGETVTLKIPRFKNDSDPLRLHLTVNQYAPDDLGEIFIETAKPNSDQDCTLGIIGILISIIIQLGGDIVEVRKSVGSRGTGITVDALLAALDYVIETYGLAPDQKAGVSDG